MSVHKRLLSLAALLTAALLVGAGFILDSTKGKAQESDDLKLLRTPPTLDGALPVDIDAHRYDGNVERTQRSADLFSWREFVALNWPVRADQRGEKDPGKSLGDPGPRVWETWKENKEVYLPEGTAPPEWNAPQGLPKEIESAAPLSMSTHLLYSTLQATQSDGAFPATLTDRRGRLVRYEIRMNKTLFDFIRKNGLYDSRIQATKESIDFPDGSMLIKAAWRELEPKEETRFVTADAWVGDLKDNKISHWRRKTMGLVGFHIVQKTPSAPEWVWTTFEHMDNVTGPTPSFHNPACKDCLPNKQTKPGTPNQVTRVALAPEETAFPAHTQELKELNHTWQKALGDARSVLQYYMLVDTQWPRMPPPKASYTPRSMMRPTPVFVSNTTMETFTQETSSCMGCHFSARTNRPDRAVFADFSFTLNNAQPVLKNPEQIPPPTRPVTEWDKQNWRAILRGRELMQRTSELLPQYVVAKLHCESCHLDTGGNPAAPWWVGQIAKYDYPKTDKLQARINRCFTHSMNGAAIPAVHGDAETARQTPEMHAFITYMKWMDEQYTARTSTPPETGLPKMPQREGSAFRGKGIFLQRCATCHGKDGQGRYESNAYYRPALWGPHAPNKAASLDDFPKLVPFIKRNMPLNSGGLLSDEEAWDVAAYIISQPHPEYHDDGSGN